MSYILTVVHNGQLERVRLFAGWEHARKTALNWANILATKPEFVDTTPDEEKGSGFSVWRFVDTNKLQVIVSFMAAITYEETPGAATKVAVSLPSTVTDPSTWTQTVAALPKPLNDDALADHLPGGWSYPDRKPVTIGEIKNGRSVYYTYELTENEKWALAIARVSKRPNCLFLLAPEGVGLYSQFHALKELKGKTSAGLIIRNREIALLANFCGEDEESDDPQMMDGNEWDESSSSESFDHY